MVLWKLPAAYCLLPTAYCLLNFTISAPLIIFNLLMIKEQPGSLLITSHLHDRYRLLMGFNLKKSHPRTNQRWLFELMTLR